MNVYQAVKSLLEKYPSCRNSDKVLLWQFWQNELETKHLLAISFTAFSKVKSPESITRARRKVQQVHKELRSTESVQKIKDKKASKKGTFIYEE